MRYEICGAMTFHMKTKKEFIDFPLLSQEKLDEMPAYIIIFEVTFDPHMKMILTIPRLKITYIIATEMRDRILRYVTENFPRERTFEGSSKPEIEFLKEIFAVSINCHHKFYKE